MHSCMTRSMNTTHPRSATPSLYKFYFLEVHVDEKRYAMASRLEGLSARKEGWVVWQYR